MSQKQEGSYLDSINFNPALWNTFYAKYLTNFRLVILLIISIVVIGIVNYLNIPRRLNPEIQIPIVIVNTILPGAGPSDIESLITVPLEDKLKSLKGLDTITSTSRDNASTIVMQFLSTVDTDEAKNDAQSAVDSVTTLPEDALTPSVQVIDFESEPIWNFAVTTDTDSGSLMRFSEELKDKISDSPKVDQVTTAGLETQEVQVIVDPGKINDYGINPLALIQTVSRAASSYPAGSLDTTSSTFSLSLDRDIMTIEDLRNIRLTVDTQTLKLGDIAQISERPKPNQPGTFYSDAKTPKKQVVQFFVYRSKTSNIDEAEQATKQIVEDTLKDYDGKFQVVTVSNAAEMITEQFTDLLHEFQSTVLLVFACLLVFLGLRQAAIASLTVPLTFLAAIAVMNIVGMSLNFLTLFAFLIALGLLIDDTIVVVAAMTRYYASGKFTPAEAGILVWRDFIVPLWSTTITTVWAFVPLLLASGIIGEFIKPIPIVVTATMLSSTSIAVLITLPLMIVVSKPQIAHRVIVLLRVLGVIALMILGYYVLPKDTPLFGLIFVAYCLVLVALYRFRSPLSQAGTEATEKYPLLKRGKNFVQRITDHGLIDLEFVSYHYRNLIARILNSRSLRRNTMIAMVIFGFVAYLLVPLGFVKNEFFPSADAEILYVSAEYPSGTNTDTTEAYANEILEKLRKVSPIKFVITEIGSNLNAESSRTQETNAALFTLHLPKLEERDITSIELAEKLRTEFDGYTKGTIAVRELSGGPPAGADLQLTLLGDDLTVLNSYADKIVAFLQKQEGINQAQKSIKTGTSKLVFVPDKDKVAAAGLTPDQIGIWLRVYASGMTLDSLKFDKDEQDIVFRLGEENGTPEALGTIAIPTLQGDSVPLLSLGTLKLSTNPTIINRESGKRTLAVTAGVAEGFVITDKNAELEKFATSLNLPPGYSWKTGGVNEENQKSVNSILQAMGLSFMLILVTMVIEFGSYRQALIVMLTIPLAISGVFYIFALTGTPLSFPALIGVLALFGIVVTNAIVVVEKINDNRKHGMGLHDAIVDASGSRLEPIVLTSLCSIFGLLPITIADPLWRGLGGAIISGLLFSGLIKLFFVPLTYYMWYGEERTTRS